MAAPEVAYYGIRHHGPGCARNLVLALSEFRPDVILIEMPAEAFHSLLLVGRRDLQPPVALLLYDPDDRDKAAFFPFAGFSPEWQALQYGAAQKIPVIPVDLPYSRACTLTDLASDGGRIDRRDPLQVLARMSGMDDGEQWWDQYVERGALGAPVFEELAQLMEALREDAGSEGTQTLHREAWMRRQIHAAVDRGHQRIAVVCGAWHVPALRKWADTKTEDDILLGPEMVKEWVSTWIPWSYRKLSKASGYGAGVHTPAWYDILFHEKEPIDHWMIRAARLLRTLGKMSSTAEVLEARRLAHAMAQLHQQPIPGLSELVDAVRVVMTDGEERWMDAIMDQLVIGDRFGEVPVDLPENPIRTDLEKALKACRLYSLWKNHERAEKEFDLRKPTGALASQLLHRLLILDIQWGFEIPLASGTTGNFREAWLLRWDEDLEMRIAQAGMYGNTIEEACIQYLLEQSTRQLSLSALAGYLQRSVKASLAALPERFFEHYERALAGEEQITELLVAYSQLFAASRYGTVREIDRKEIDRLLDATFPRILAGLAEGLRQVGEDDAFEAWSAVREMLTFAGLREQEGLDELYMQLLPLSGYRNMNPYLAGAIQALLFDRQFMDAQQAFRIMSLWLSDTERPDHAAAFAEGFLQGAGGHIWQDDRWLTGLDEYVSGLREDGFDLALPVLRRAFSRYSAGERRRILGIVRQPRNDERSTPLRIHFDEERMRALWLKWS